MIITNHVNAERSVLSTLMTYEDQYDAISGLISADDFESVAHQDIYTIIVDLVERNQPHDLVMVSDLLDSRFKGKDFDYINMRLAEAAGTPAAMPKSLLAHVELIKTSALRRKSQRIVKQAADRLLGNEPTDEVNSKLVNELSNLDQKEGAKEVYSVDDMMQSLVERMASANAGVKTYIELGFPELDSLMKVRKGNLAVIGARPSMGKSLLVMNIQAHLAKFAEGVSVFFSVEMEQDDLMDRLTASETGIPIDAIVNCRMTEDQQASFQKFASSQKDMRLQVVRKTGLSVAQIRMHLNRLKREYGKIASIGVDYLQIMDGLNDEDSVSKIGATTTGLKAIASEFECPVFLLAQLNRDLEKRPNKRPVMSDLRGSGAIEQDADQIAFIYREDYYKQKDGDTDLDGMADIILSKNRNGKTGVVRLAFEGHMGRFSNDMPYHSGFNDIPNYGE